MTDLDSAILLLEGELDKLGLPKKDTVDWWVLRAKSTGLTLLRTMRAKNLFEPEAAEVFRRGLRMELVGEVDARSVH